MGYVYLIYDKSNNVYKIGVTRSKESKRLRQLQTGNSTKLDIIYLYETEYPFRLETMLHNHYKPWLVHGEWYNIDDVDKYKYICKQFDDNIKALKDNPFFSKGLK